MTLRLTTITFIILLTLLLAYDYFPDLKKIIEIPRPVFISIFIGLVIVSLILNPKNEGGKENRNELRWDFFIILYIIAVMIIFSLLGGTSSAGVSFSNVVFWIVLGISIIKLYFQWKKQ